MTLEELLNYLLSPVGAGVFLWGFLAFIIKLIPGLDKHSNAKFWLAMVMSFVVPVAGYWGRVAMGLDVWNVQGFFLAVGVGYTVSQTVHRATEQASGRDKKPLQTIYDAHREW